MPACSGCLKAKVECHSISRSDNIHIPRNIAAFLESAIADLELQLGSRAIATNAATTGDAFQSSETFISGGFMAPLPPQFCPSITRTLAVPYKASLLQQSSFPPSVRPWPCSSKGSAELCSKGVDGRKLAALAVPDAAARTLFDVFITRLLPLHPIFQSAELEDVFANVYLQGEQPLTVHSYSHCDLFITSIVFANSCSANQPNELGRNRSFYASLLSDALSMLSCVQNTSMESLQCLLLLVQHALLNPQSGSLYNLSGDAMKMATALGLHQEPVCPDSSECERRRCLFWVVCN